MPRLSHSIQVVLGQESFAAGTHDFGPFELKGDIFAIQWYRFSTATANLVTAFPGVGTAVSLTPYVTSVPEEWLLDKGIAARAAPNAGLTERQDPTRPYFFTPVGFSFPTAPALADTDEGDFVSVSENEWTFAMVRLVTAVTLSGLYLTLTVASTGN